MTATVILSLKSRYASHSAPHRNISDRHLRIDSSWTENITEISISINVTLYFSGGLDNMNQPTSQEWVPEQPLLLIPPVQSNLKNHRIVHVEGNL